MEEVPVIHTLEDAEQDEDKVQGEEEEEEGTDEENYVTFEEVKLFSLPSETSKDRFSCVQRTHRTTITLPEAAPPA